MAKRTRGNVEATMRHVRGSLNRDAALTLRYREFTIVPRGRVLFIPAFVVLACEREMVSARRSRRLNDTTRQHLTEELEQLAAGFRG